MPFLCSCISADTAPVEPVTSAADSCAVSDSYSSMDVQAKERDVGHEKSSASEGLRNMSTKRAPSVSVKENSREADNALRKPTLNGCNTTPVERHETRNYRDSAYDSGSNHPSNRSIPTGGDVPLDSLCSLLVEEGNWDSDLFQVDSSLGSWAASRAAQIMNDALLENSLANGLPADIEEKVGKCSTALGARLPY
jgi:hypothetical protein